MNVIIEKKLPKTISKQIKVISWNLDIENCNMEAKINEINEKNADIIMLQESNPNIKFINYISYETAKSHKGIISLFIHKRICPELINVFKYNGILIYHLNTKFGQIIVASIHLPPFNKINDKILRSIAIYKMISFLKNENLTKLPIIVGGNTNMQDDEHIRNLSEDILKDLCDGCRNENNYRTWSAKNNLNKKFNSELDNSLS